VDVETGLLDELDKVDEIVVVKEVILSLHWLMSFQKTKVYIRHGFTLSLQTPVLRNITLFSTYGMDRLLISKTRMFLAQELSMVTT
jgi:hypothetical protein